MINERSSRKDTKSIRSIVPEILHTNHKTVACETITRWTIAVNTTEHLTSFLCLGMIVFTAAVTNLCHEQTR